MKKKGVYVGKMDGLEERVSARDEEDNELAEVFRCISEALDTIQYSCDLVLSNMFGSHATTDRIPSMTIYENELEMDEIVSIGESHHLCLQVSYETVPEISGTTNEVPISTHGSTKEREVTNHLRTRPHTPPGSHDRARRFSLTFKRMPAPSYPLAHVTREEARVALGALPRDVLQMQQIAQATILGTSMLRDNLQRCILQTKQDVACRTGETTEGLHHVKESTRADMKALHQNVQTAKEVAARADMASREAQQRIVAVEYSQQQQITQLIACIEQLLEKQEHQDALLQQKDQALGQLTWEVQGVQQTLENKRMRVVNVHQMLEAERVRVGELNQNLEIERARVEELTEQIKQPQ